MTDSELWSDLPPRIGGQITPKNWRAELPPELRQLPRPAPMPDWIVPMAATLTKDRFDDPEWIFEMKLDGIRYLARVDSGIATLLTRNRLQHRHADVEHALTAQSSRQFIVDGERVSAGRDRDGRARYHVFDIVYLDGYDLTALPLHARKQILRSALAWVEPLAFVEELPGGGLRAYEQATAERWEGIVAKHRDSVYEPRRSRQWLKMKCNASQELVVGGFTDPNGVRTGFGALLVGYYDGDDFVFAGKLGTGFDTQLLTELRTQLDALEVPTSPFTRSVGLPKLRAHWVRPQIVVEAAFMEWTGGGKLRHPSFVRVREDKTAREVVRES